MNVSVSASAGSTTVPGALPWKEAPRRPATLGGAVKLESYRF
jgi:hypothetical protein